MTVGQAITNKELSIFMLLQLLICQTRLLILPLLLSKRILKIKIFSDEKISLVVVIMVLAMVVAGVVLAEEN